MSVLSRRGADSPPFPADVPGPSDHDRAAEGSSGASAAAPADESASSASSPATKRPLYPRLLRLRHVAPNAWQRALLGEGALAVAALLVLADFATAWTLVVLPLAVAAVVKAHDLLAGAIAGGRAEPPAGGRAEPPAGASRAEPPVGGSSAESPAGGSRAELPDS